MAREQDYWPGFDRGDHETDDLRHPGYRGAERPDFTAGGREAYRRDYYVGSEYEGTGTLGNRGGRDFDDSYRGGYGSFSSGRAPYGGRGYEGPGYGGGTGGSHGGRGYDGGVRYGGGYGAGGFRNRGGDEVSSWFGDENAESGHRMNQYRGRGPKGYARSDERIEEDVNDRLTEDWSLDASDIEVDVKEGEVTLSGEVSSRAEKRAPRISPRWRRGSGTAKTTYGSASPRQPEPCRQAGPPDQAKTVRLQECGRLTTRVATARPPK